jgi:hypothetical protein
MPLLKLELGKIFPPLLTVKMVAGAKVPEVALIFVAPACPELVANPGLAGELLMVATAELLEVQLTDPVMSGVVPSL